MTSQLYSLRWWRERYDNSIALAFPPMVMLCLIALGILVFRNNIVLGFSYIFLLVGGYGGYMAKKRKGETC